MKEFRGVDINIFEFGPSLSNLILKAETVFKVLRFHIQSVVQPVKPTRQPHMEKCSTWIVFASSSRSILIYSLSQSGFVCDLKGQNKIMLKFHSRIRVKSLPSEWSSPSEWNFPSEWEVFHPSGVCHPRGICHPSEKFLNTSGTWVRYMNSEWKYNYPIEGLMTEWKVSKYEWNFGQGVMDSKWKLLSEWKSLDRLKGVPNPSDSTRR